MKILVCGSRDWRGATLIEAVVAGLDSDDVVITGMARGADRMARHCAVQRGLFVIDVPVLDPHWKRRGRRAGHERNHVMLGLHPDRVVAFQVAGSAGTQGTIDEARRRGIPVEVHTQPELERDTGRS